MMDPANPLRKCLMAIFVILLLAAEVWQQVQTKDIILENEEDVVVSILKDTSLNVRCNYSGSFDSIDFQWKKMKNNVWYLDSSETILTRTEWLNFEKFDLSQGLYTCSINGSNGNKTISENRRFVLMTSLQSNYNRKKKPIFQKKLADNILLLQSSTLHLNCPFSSESDTEFSWYKNDKLLKKRKAIIEGNVVLDNDYSSKSVQLSDAGNYTCKVNNTEGSIQHDFTVVVYEDGKNIPQDYLEYPISLSLKSGETANFNCKALADYGYNDIEWYYLSGTNPTDIDLQTVNILQFKKMETDFDGVSSYSNLTIKNITIDDAGWYICMVFGNQKILMAEAQLEVDKRSLLLVLVMASTLVVFALLILIYGFVKKIETFQRLMVLTQH